MRIRLGTRSSKLAIRQANIVFEAIKAIDPSVEIEIIPIKVNGDNMPDNYSIIGIPMGNKGLFTKEIEDRLLSREIDGAIHSVKDLGVRMNSELSMHSVLRRDISADCFISHKYQNLFSLPNNAKIGTSSIRRNRMLKVYNDNFEIINCRGNIDTRLNKMMQKDLDGIILSMCGLNRMKISDYYQSAIDYKIMLPAIGQGAICVQIKNDLNPRIKDIIRKTNDLVTEKCITAERFFGLHMNADCGMPIACNVEFKNNMFYIIAEYITESFKKIHHNEICNEINLNESIIKTANIIKHQINQ